MEVLRKSGIRIEEIGIHSFFKNPVKSAALANSCTVVHIQYETSLFLNKRKDIYPRITRLITRPIIVTIHEIYQNTPFFFPRERLTGTTLFLTLKRFLYDYRHPYATAYKNHIKNAFHADLIHVHYRYQKDLLQESISKKIKIFDQPFPISKFARPSQKKSGKSNRIKLTAAGFISPAYNYELLFESLNRLKSPWEFTWLGDFSDRCDDAWKKTFHSLVQKFQCPHLFTITGWLETKEWYTLLSEQHLFLALYNYRSTSSTIAAAIGAAVPVLSTPLALTRELHQTGAPVMLAPTPPEAVAEAVEQWARDRDSQKRLNQLQESYSRVYSLENFCSRLIEEYQQLL